MQVIDGGSQTFDALAYGDPHPGTVAFFQNQMENLSQYAGQVGEQFIQSAQDLYSRFNHSTAMRYARAAKRSLGSIFQNDAVRQLASIAELQQAPPVMQRWIMAEPTTRKMYHRQMVEGYEGSYKDAFPNDVGESHYDYRRVMDGLVVDDPDTEDWVATTYLDEIFEGDHELEIDQQADIFYTWKMTKARILHGGSDPTSRWNADL